MIMAPIKHYKCKKCKEPYLNEDEVEMGMDVTLSGHVIRIYTHKGDCGGLVEETELFKRYY